MNAQRTRQTSARQAQDIYSSHLRRLVCTIKQRRQTTPIRPTYMPISQPLSMKSPPSLKSVTAIPVVKQRPEGIQRPSTSDRAFLPVRKDRHTKCLQEELNFNPNLLTGRRVDAYRDTTTTFLRHCAKDEPKKDLVTAAVKKWMTPIKRPEIPVKWRVFNQDKTVLN